MSSPPLREYPKVLNRPFPTDLPSITCRGQWNTGRQHSKPETYHVIFKYRAAETRSDIHLTGFFWDSLFTPHPYVDLPRVVEWSSYCKVCRHEKQSDNPNKYPGVFKTREGTATLLVVFIHTHSASQEASNKYSKHVQQRDNWNFIKIRK